MPYLAAWLLTNGEKAFGNELAEEVSTTTYHRFESL
jgi:hypothetical protein